MISLAALHRFPRGICIPFQMLLLYHSPLVFQCFFFLQNQLTWTVSEFPHCVKINVTWFVVNTVLRMEIAPKIFDTALNSNEPFVPPCFIMNRYRFNKCVSVHIAKIVRFCMASFWVYLLDFRSTKNKNNVLSCHIIPRKHEHIRTGMFCKHFFQLRLSRFYVLFVFCLLQELLMFKYWYFEAIFMRNYILKGSSLLWQNTDF